MKPFLLILMLATGTAMVLFRSTGDRSGDAGAAFSSPASAAAEGNSEQAEPIESVAIKAKPRAWLRHTRTAGPDDVVGLRRAALHDEDPLIAGNAVRALGWLGLVKANTELGALIDSPHARVRQEAVLALGESGDPAAAEILAGLVRPDEPLAPLAVRALGRLGVERASRELGRIAKDDQLDQTSRLFAEQSLRRTR